MIIVLMGMLVRLSEAKEKKKHTHARRRFRGMQADIKGKWH